MTDESEYVAQLKEVFQSCDSSGSGHLSRRDLVELCEKLQLEDQAEALIEKLIGNSHTSRVGFEEFKDGFVSVLSSVVDTLDSTEDEASARDNVQASPMPNRDAKRYGRHSLPGPQGADTPLDFPNDLSDSEVSYVSPSETPQLGTKRRLYSTPVNPNAAAVTYDDGDAKRPRSTDDLSNSQADTFEAEGQMNHSMAESERLAVDAAGEEAHLRAIWRFLGVGINGYITVSELALVCNHIGMEAMNDQELNHLFKKLDADCDERVSFDEFLSGLFQHGGSNTGQMNHPRQQSLTPVRSLSSQKRAVRISSSLTQDGDLGTQTPSILSVVSGSGFFSYMDPEATGYALAEDVTEVWESFGVVREDAQAVLQALEFDGNSKVNLQELSMALEQELLTNDLDNAIYQVAVYSCRQELRHVKSALDSKRAEADKLQQEMDAANARNTLLVKESDERYIMLERTLEARSMEAERRHSELLRSVQAQAGEERELLSAASTRQRLLWESVSARHREEELRLKETVVLANAEVSRLEAELHECIEKCGSLTTESSRTKKDLDIIPILRNQVLEMEASIETLKCEQTRYSRQKLEQHEEENKTLKDRNDELITEMENLKQQLAGRSRKTRSKSRSGSSTTSLFRQGSRISDYTTQQREPKQENGSQSDDSSNSEGMETRSKRVSSMGQSVPPMAVQVEQLKKEIHSLHAKNEEAQKDIEVQHEKETRDKERAHQVELTARVGDVERREKETVDRMQLEEKRRSQHRESDWQRRLDSEKAQLKVEASRELRALSEKLEAEKEELLLRERATATRQVKEVQMALNAAVHEKEATESRCQQKISEYEDAFAKHGIHALRGHLREDFNRLVERQVKDQLELERQDFAASRDGERAAQQRRHEEQLDEVEQQMAELEQQMGDDKVAQQRRHEQQLAELEQQMEDEKLAHQQLLEQQLSTLEQQMANEKMALEQSHELHVAELQQQMEDEKEFLAEDVRSRMEGEFVEEIEKISTAFQEERNDYEVRLHRLEVSLQHATATSLAATAMADTDRLRKTDAEAVQQEKHGFLRQLDGAALDKAKLEHEVMTLKREVEHRQRTHDREAAALRAQLADRLRSSTDLNATEAANVDALRRENGAFAEEKAWLIETKDDLVMRLQQADDRIFDLSTQLQLAESQHGREVLELKLQLGKMVAVSTHRGVEALLAAERQRCEQLERALDERATESNLLLLNAQEEHKLAMMEASSGRDELSRKLVTTRASLAEVTQRLKEQLEKTTRSDYLVKDLYIENAQLMKALYITEQLQKKAEHTKYTLESHCKALQDALVKICPAAAS